jgi:hypothetical protein
MLERKWKVRGGGGRGEGTKAIRHECMPQWNSSRGHRKSLGGSPGEACEGRFLELQEVCVGFRGTQAEDTENL